MVIKLSELLKTERLNFVYNQGEEDSKQVLSDVNLTIKSGEFVAVLGHNGSGKSTLAKHFNAILLPSGGTVYVNGIDTRLEDKLFEIRQNVGMVFQNPDNQLVATLSLIHIYLPRGIFLHLNIHRFR